MSAYSNTTIAEESPPIIVFQSRALRIPSVCNNEYGCTRDPQYSTPRKRSLVNDSIRTPIHISKRSRLCSGDSSAHPPKYELCVQPVNMSFVLSGIEPYYIFCTSRNPCIPLAAADNSENSPPRLAAAMQRPWVLDSHPCLGQACILQFCASPLVAIARP